MSKQTASQSHPLLALIGQGAVTSVGSSAGQTLASFIGHSRRMRRIRLEGYADPFTIADCQRITENLAGTDRLAALLESAVLEATEALAPMPADARRLDILVLPTWLDPQGVADMSQRLDDWLPSPPSQERQRIVLQAGADGAWRALDQAYRWLDRDSRPQYVLIAAVGSECEPAVLARSAEQDRLLRAGFDEGFVPGEAGACVILQCVAGIQSIAAERFVLHRPALHDSGQRLWPADAAPDPKPLATALQHAMQAAGMGPTHISHLESDMDGSEWRALLESAALGRAVFSETDALPQMRPAGILGQTGPAAGLIGWILPALAQRERVQRINTVLTWAIDSEGGLAANVLERSPL